jgi:hypothetical protein
MTEALEQRTLLSVPAGSGWSSFGSSSGPSIIVSIDASLHVSVAQTGVGPFDDIEDTYVGVVNNSDRSIRSLRMSGATDIFGFDGDGIQTFGSPAPSGYPAEITLRGYEGPDNYFTGAGSSGSVTFIGGLDAHQQTYFSLEGIPEEIELDVDQPSKLVLTKATTLDAKDVTITYMVALNDITAPLRFDIYRSDISDGIDSASEFLGTQTLSASESLPISQGTHTETLSAATSSLPPDQQNHLKNKYIVIVADSDNSVGLTDDSQPETYFQTFMLAAVSHGFSFPNVSLSKGSIKTNTVPDWETQMVADLKTQGYDDAYPFNWVSTSFLPKSGQATAAGDRLYTEIVPISDQLASHHPGDVVDLHFIGHSRGAVVISRAMQDLVARQTTDLALQGSYIKATFLDPHPASAATVFLASSDPKPIAALARIAPNLGPALLGAYAGVLAGYASVATLAKDPQVVIPLNVQYAEAAYQHTSASAFSLLSIERYLNLWGEGPQDGIINNSGHPIHWTDLSNTVDNGSVTVSGTTRVIGPIGHSEVPLWYLKHQVDDGLAAIVS